MKATTFVIRRRGGSCAQVDKPEIQEPDRPEGLPHTVAIARNCGIKRRLQSWLGRCCACILPGYQSRSLIWQRRDEGKLDVSMAATVKNKHVLFFYGFNMLVSN